MVLEAAPAVLEVVDDEGALRVTLEDLGATPELNRLLIEAGVAIRRFEPRQATLEQRFLALTTRLETAA